jgi:hypothetical protein
MYLYHLYRLLRSSILPSKITNKTKLLVVMLDKHTKFTIKMHPENASKLKIESGNFLRTIRLKRTTGRDF